MITIFHVAHCTFRFIYVYISIRSRLHSATLTLPTGLWKLLLLMMQPSRNGEKKLNIKDIITRSTAVHYAKCCAIHSASMLFHSFIPCFFFLFCLLADVKYIITFNELCFSLFLSFRASTPFSALDGKMRKINNENELHHGGKRWL